MGISEQRLFCVHRVSRARASSLVRVALSLLLLPASASLLAADPPALSEERTPYSVVFEALEAEIEGDFLLRQRLLNQAGTTESAKSYRGLIEEEGEWKGVDASIADAQSSELLEEYERRRASLADDIPNHFGMARWCKEKELWGRCRSHLARIIELEPDNVAARQALGYQLMRGEWISPEQLQELSQRTQFAETSLKEFAPRIGAVRALLAKPHSQSQARNSLLRVTDPAAVPCVEQLLGQGNLAEAQLAVEWLGTIDSVAASEALARFGVFHSNPTIRQLATEQLEGRSYYDYVPQLLALMESPVQMMVMPVFDNSGELQGYRQAFAKEKMDRMDYLVVDRSVVRVENRNAFPQPLDFRVRRTVQAMFRDLAEQNIRAEANAESRVRAARMLRDNENIEQRNERVLALLAATTKAEVERTPKALWEWWDGYNDANYQKSKPERLRREESTVAYFTPPLGQESHECFVAGTPVVTQRGEKPIESIVAGDLVLSRDLQTGTLDWKPILRATTRSPEPTFRIVTDGDELTCTAGHLFWVSGSGWRKAKELKPGDILHGAKQPSVVLRTLPDLRLPTYNLEVADFGNYFVGKARIMSHDVRPRGVNRETVPGLKYVEFMAGKANTTSAGAAD